MSKGGIIGTLNDTNSSIANLTRSAWAGATDDSEITFYLQG